MAESHVPEVSIGRFVRGELSREEAQQVIRHLLTGCPQCSEMMHRATREAGLFGSAGRDGAIGWQQTYETVFRQALAFASELEQQLAEEKLQGWAQWAALEPLPPSARLARVQADPRFHTFGLYTRLLEASRWALRSEPAEAVDIVRLAVSVAEWLDPSRIAERHKADLRASAWATLGNTQRIAEDFEGARRALNEAWRILEEEGTNDPLDRAFIVSLEASYLMDIGEFETAESALEESLETYQRIDDPHGQGRVLLQMGQVIGNVHPERGIAHIQRALGLIELSREPQLELGAQHALAGFLSDLGRPEAALAVLDRARPLYERLGDELTQLRLHWLEGKIAHRLGKLDEAEHIFGQLWEELRVRDLNQEVVLVSIEIAQVLTQKGETARAAEMAAQCFSIMKSWRLHNDALAAWIVFQDALAQGAAEGKVFDKIEAYYRRHWVRPARFSS
jgi:tetratricopeptide (TPR) repeat protein